MDLRAYRKLAALRGRVPVPDPYLCTRQNARRSVPSGLIARAIGELLTRYDAGLVSERTLLRGKDTGRDKKDTLSYWLYIQHYPGSERWKLLGQRYWSREAWRSWCIRMSAMPFDAVLDRDGLPHLMSFPKRSTAGDSGLLSEHVVPQKVLKRCLLDERASLEKWVERNLCCVITRTEDRRLHRNRHPDPRDPWQRYRDTGIVLLHNPLWSDEEIMPLLRHGLVDERSFVG